MPVFEYTGLTEAGKNVRGLRDAESSKTLRALLRKDGVYLTESRPAEDGAVEGQQKTGMAREVDVILANLEDAIPAGAKDAARAGASIHVVPREVRQRPATGRLPDRFPRQRTSLVQGIDFSVDSERLVRRRGLRRIREDATRNRAQENNAQRD